MKELIVYNKILELKGYISDDEYDNLIKKYAYVKDYANTNEVIYFCTVCNNDKCKGEMYVYSHNDSVGNICKSCLDKRNAINSIVNKIIEVIPTPKKDRFKRLEILANDFNRDIRIRYPDESPNYSSLRDNTLAFYCDYICDRCDEQYKYCETIKCPFKKRFDLIEQVSKDMNEESIINKNKAKSLITEDHINFKVALLNLNRKIKEKRKI
jgi:hypothetical protein